jgi:membrane protein implicated in regulation of membrane protease activity
MVGHVGAMRRGSIFIDGELWSARPVDGAELPSEGRVRVVGREGMTLIVEPVDAAAPSETSEPKES